MPSDHMDWARLLASSRVGHESEKDRGRNEFTRDIDRIIFCDAFRRLGRKTQVHPLNDNDHIHTRLAHSLETASVGRSLGESVGRWLRDGQSALPGGIAPHHLGQVVHAACLAHDIGNPPFGHSGENAIKDWFQAHPEALDAVPEGLRPDFLKFDGNAMSMRILVSTGFHREGMSPTHAVFGALLKYPWFATRNMAKDKFSVLRTEADAMTDAAHVLGLPETGPGRYARHPLAHLTEAADDICYRIIDLEDAMEMDILPRNYLLDAFKDVLGYTAETEERLRGQHFRQRNGRIRAGLITGAVQQITTLFRKQYDTIMTGAPLPAGSLMDTAQDGVCATIRDVYEDISPSIFYSRRKALLELGADNAIGRILDTLAPAAAAMARGQKTPASGKVLTLLGLDDPQELTRGQGDPVYLALVRVLDYLTGMTDHFATHVARSLMGLGSLPG